MITLTTDFGLKDPYVAEMKGVILSINPEAKLIDVTHNVNKFDIRMGAFILASAASYFPKGTVHLAVVDPGVGTDRRAIVVQTKESLFVGPDNGLLMLAAQSQGIEHVYELTDSKFRLPEVSCTFHGRDIFAPAAAYLDKGIMPCKFGLEVADPIIPSFAVVTESNSMLCGEILQVDDFGNVVTNIEAKDLGNTKFVNLDFDGCSFDVFFAKTYADVKPKEAIALMGSHGFLELALNQGNAAEKFGVHTGDAVKVTIF